MSELDELREVQTASREIYNGKIMHVFEDMVRLPDGNSATREYMRHIGAVCVVPVLDNGDVLVERQYRYPVAQVLTEIPAGKLDRKDEDHLLAAQRELREETGAEFFMINLSGGIGIPYRLDQQDTDIALVGRGVREAFEEICVPAGMGNIRIAAELGRYISGPAGWLVTRDIHEKHTHKEYIGVDACAADLMRPAMYGAYHHITIAGREAEAPVQKYDVVGSLCENNDKFAVDRMLPRVNMGDLLVIHDTGAHGRSMGYNYNGRLRSAEVLLKEDGSFELIRRAETPRDYFVTLDFTGILDGVLKSHR